MTPTEQAARWLANVERYGLCPVDGKYISKEGNWVRYADALAAIARHLAPDDLVAQATAALEGVTDGPWRVDGEPWNQIVWSGADNRVCFMAHSNGLDDDRDVATARFIAFARHWVPEAAAHISALTATVAEAQAEKREMALQELASLGQAQDAYEAQLAAETEAATLRDRLARMEEAQKMREEISALEKLCDHDCDNEDCVRCFHYPDILEQKREQLAALTDGGTE